ncbi:MAG: hypothetical protein A3F84_09460 [Candidatus Handelsmanbacteria bacterium RIFCSPLOWO2_12_FULL_64_10]|uniref:Chordopoxvirus fusion protein n=1 Tax=Handelsmanbacteria sp. (strain RIFCSPLOWO2_12_FULL_64_10) TaxID=1817868 RepID=A0A1F6C5R1_HANXR|nr:MAG: hypothetical protein A3F84_09460 [Candidatus Handelsmanbacteria bacterium RIFCSPLOWO2_12_FULL_64_10]
MLTADEIRQRLTGVFDEAQAATLTEVLKGVYEARGVDLSDLKDVVKELAVAQQRTEERLERVEKVIEELAVAQKRTEERLEQLVAAQQRTEGRLDRIEKAIEELIAAQKRTEKAIEELAAAQKRTEKELQALVSAHTETRRQLGGLTATVGYTLENEAYKALPALLKRDAGLTVHDRLKRTYVSDDEGEALEVNIFGEARVDGREVVIVGESKVLLSRNDVDRFLRRKLKPLSRVLGDVFPVLVTHMTSDPAVEAYAREKGVAVYFSYDF